MARSRFPLAQPLDLLQILANGGGHVLSSQKFVKTLIRSAGHAAGSYLLGQHAQVQGQSAGHTGPPGGPPAAGLEQVAHLRSPRHPHPAGHPRHVRLPRVRWAPAVVGRIGQLSGTVPQRPHSHLASRLACWPARLAPPLPASALKPSDTLMQTIAWYPAAYMHLLVWLLRFLPMHSISDELLHRIPEPTCICF